MATFNRMAYEATFDKRLITLQDSEKVSKAELQTLANDTVEMTHVSGQIVYMNKVMAVLSPFNKRLAKTFFLYFAGYHYDEKTNLFDKKSSKRYPEALKRWNTFKEDPLNNIWTFSRDIKVEAPPLTIGDVGKRMSTLWSAGHRANISNVDMLKAMLTATQPTKGKKDIPKLAFTLGDVIDALQSLDVEVAAQAGQGSEFLRGNAANIDKPAQGGEVKQPDEVKA